MLWLMTTAAHTSSTAVYGESFAYAAARVCLRMCVHAQHLCGRPCGTWPRHRLMSAAAHTCSTAVCGESCMCGGICVLAVALSSCVGVHVWCTAAKQMPGRCLTVLALGAD
jgi:hypothetical protein